MNVRPFDLLCTVQVAASATGWSPVQGSPTERVSPIACDQVQQQTSTPTTG